MSKVRVHELAKGLNLQSKELINIINGLGVEVKSHMSILEGKDLEIVIGHFRKIEAEKNKKNEKKVVKTENKSDEKKNNVSKERKDNFNKDNKNSKDNNVQLLIKGHNSSMIKKYCKYQTETYTHIYQYWDIEDKDIKILSDQVINNLKIIKNIIENGLDFD